MRLLPFMRDRIPAAIVPPHTLLIAGLKACCIVSFQRVYFPLGVFAGHESIGELLKTSEGRQELVT